MTIIKIIEVYLVNMNKKDWNAGKQQRSRSNTKTHSAPFDWITLRACCVKCSMKTENNDVERNHLAPGNRMHPQAWSRMRFCIEKIKEIWCFFDRWRGGIMKASASMSGCDPPISVLQHQTLQTRHEDTILLYINSLLQLYNGAFFTDHKNHKPWSS